MAGGAKGGLTVIARQPSPVDEHGATGETARIYHDIRQTLRVSGVNLNFRTWAGFDRFFPRMWKAMRGVAGSGAFESAADDIRSEAVPLASALPSLGGAGKNDLGEGQQAQIKAALELYHYINPKLLVFTSIVSQALEQRSASAIVLNETRLPRGVPPGMFPMEMVDERPSDPQIRKLFQDIKQTMNVTAVNSDYRTLAMWPDYLDGAWRALKPMVKSPAYQNAATTLGATATSRARELVRHVALDRNQVARSGEDVTAVVQTTAQFERLLPPLILNIATISLDWWPADELVRSPFSAGKGS